MAEFTNVLVTDTFDQWRIKTNNIGADVTALIGTVETDLDAFRLEIGTTISDFENDLANTLADLNTTYVTLATAQTISGEKTFQNTVDANGTVFLNYDDSGANTFGVEIGASTSTSQSFIDFHAGQVYDDYAARIFRKNTGEFQITQRGPAALHLDTHDGANIEMYGDSATSETRNSIFYDATNHYFRDKNGANSGLTVNNGGITINTGKMKLNGLDYTWPSERVGNRYLKTDVNGGLSWAAVAGGTGDVNLSTLVFNDIVPVGTIMPWAGTSLPADGKWKFCNGGQFSQATYPELWAVLGGTAPKYGAADGNSLLPNLNGRVPVGTGTASGFNAGAVGTTGGFATASISGNTASHTLTINQIPAHRHAGSAANYNGDTNDAFAWGVVDTNVQNVSTNSFTSDGTDGDSYGWTGYAGGINTTNASPGTTQGHSHSLSGSVSTIQPYLTTQYIIKVLPDDVQQVSIDAGNGINVKDAADDDSITLDLFSTKIELLTDNQQFKFNNRRLELVTPAVSQANITLQIASAVSGLAETSYVDTAVSGLTTKEYVDTNIPAFYSVMVSGNRFRSTPADMRADRGSASFYGAWDEYSKGSINTGFNNSQYPSENSLMYTMHVNVLQNTVVTMYNFSNDDAFYIYQDDVLLYSGSNIASTVPRVVTFTLTAGIRRIDIVKNDYGAGSNRFELMGNIIGPYVRFIPVGY